MKSYSPTIWFSDFISLGNELLQIGASGEINLVVKPKMSREDLDSMLAPIASIAGPALPFLAELYSTIGAGMFLKVVMELPEGWEAKYEDTFYANFDLCGPQDLLQLSDYNQYRANDVEGKPAFPPEFAAAHNLSPQSNEVINHFIQQSIEEYDTFSAILRDCLMFCRDDTGGGVAYYNGDKRPAGVYSLTMDGARYIAPTMEHFFMMVEEHAFGSPVSDIDWNGSAGKRFRERLRLENAALSRVAKSK